jgi:hypothetical protein
MIPNRLLRLLAGVIVLTFILACLLHQSVYSAFTTAATVGGLFLVVWDRYLWHLWPFYPYFDNKPDLRGTWRGLVPKPTTTHTPHTTHAPYLSDNRRVVFLSVRLDFRLSGVALTVVPTAGWARPGYR